jgi:hypothetical protein
MCDGGLDTLCGKTVDVCRVVKGGIYTKHDFRVAPCHTTASDQIRINPNFVGCCHTTRCDTKIVFRVNRP